MSGVWARHEHAGASLPSCHLYHHRPSQACPGPRRFTCSHTRAAYRLAGSRGIGAVAREAHAALCCVHWVAGDAPALGHPARHPLDRPCIGDRKQGERGGRRVGGRAGRRLHATRRRCRCSSALHAQRLSGASSFHSSASASVPPLRGRSRGGGDIMHHAHLRRRQALTAPRKAVVAAWRSVKEVGWAEMGLLVCDRPTRACHR